MIKIDADFNSVDSKGRIILGIFVSDLMSEQVELKEGMHVILKDYEMEVEAVLEFEKGSSGALSDMLGGRPGEEGSWRARILPGTGRSRDVKSAGQPRRTSEKPRWKDQGK